MAKETLFTKLTSPTQPERVSPAPAFAPQVDIIEEADAVIVLADMPGVSKEKVDVVLEQGVLMIDGTVERNEGKGMRRYIEEYEVGNFHRSFTLGAGLDADNVEATMEDGVLRLVIRKEEEMKPHRIEIK